MSEDKPEIAWDQLARGNFEAILAKIPVFLRPIAEKKVAKKALDLAVKENRSHVSQKDVIDAFFMETPFGFHGPMKMDMEALGIDYTRYGHSK